MSRALRARLIVHASIGVLFAGIGAYCLSPWGSGLANSIPYLAFVSNFAIVYGAASSLEAVHAGRKADPDDPA